MRSIYPISLTPSDDQLKEVWQDCLFVFDTSVLLNLYEYSPISYKEATEAMQKIKERVWMPHHVGWEFMRRREKVISNQIATYKH